MNVPSRRCGAIIRAAGTCGYVPIETLALGRQDYDPYAEVTKMHPSLRAALEKKG